VQDVLADKQVEGTPAGEVLAEGDYEGSFVEKQV